MLEKRFLRNKTLYERYLQSIRTIKKKDSFLKESFFFRRASDGNRTRDLLTTNEVLQHPTKDGIPPVTVSAGIRTFEGSYNDVILKQADIALYYTKQHGREGCTVYQSFLTPAED